MKTRYKSLQEINETNEKDKTKLNEKVLASERQIKELSQKIHEMSIQLIDHDTNASTTVSITQKLQKDLVER